MSNYIRTTRECPVNQLRPELFRVLRDYFLEHGLGDLETETLLCYETTSTKKETNKLASWLNAGMDEKVDMAVLFTSQWLVWARSGDKSGIQVTSADLKKISVRVYASMLPREAGLEIAGKIEDTKGVMRGYIAMESISVAEKFCDEVNQVIDKVKPPVKNSISKWWSGPTR